MNSEVSQPELKTNFDFPSQYHRIRELKNVSQEMRDELTTALSQFEIASDEFASSGFPWKWDFFDEREEITQDQINIELLQLSTKPNITLVYSSHIRVAFWHYTLAIESAEINNLDFSWSNLAKFNNHIGVAQGIRESEKRFQNRKHKSEEKAASARLQSPFSPHAYQKVLIEVLEKHTPSQGWKNLKEAARELTPFLQEALEDLTKTSRTNFSTGSKTKTADQVFSAIRGWKKNKEFKERINMYFPSKSSHYPDN